MDQKEKILKFIKKQRFCVLSTVSAQNKSESALIEFGETNDLELIFDTITNFRKYKNLQSNPQVSVVIGWENFMSIQYEGVATEVTGQERIYLQNLYFQKRPTAKDWSTYPTIAYFKITPKWIRFSDWSVTPWKTFEIDFSALG